LYIVTAKLKRNRITKYICTECKRESRNILDSKLKIAVALASVILVAFVAPVLAVDYNPGVSIGTYVKYGNWLVINAATGVVLDWQKVEVIAVSGKEVTLRMTGQLKNGTAMPHSGDTYVYDVETGATNYTHSVLGFVIAANLNEGDAVPSGSNNYMINKTEIRTYVENVRVVNVLAEVISGVDDIGPYTARLTFVYDKASGLLLETEIWVKWPNTPNDRVIYSSVTHTNIFSPSPSPPQIPVEIIYAVAVAVAVTPIGTAAVLRRRKQPEAKTKMLEAKVMDLTYNLSGVNRGECYLADSLEHCVKIVCDLHSRGVSALAIVREDPAFLTKTCNLQPDDVVLLSSQPIKGFKAISSLQEISIAIMKFVKAGGGVVLLDGLEYLISRFGFNTVYMCLQEKKIEFLETGAVLLVPVNMETLDNREKGQLLSELKLL
jgi:hypothetical protein